MTLGNAQFVWFDMKLLKRKDMKPPEKAIVLALMENMPSIYPTLRTLCERTGLCRNTILKYLKILESKGILKRLKRLGSSNIYMFSKMYLKSSVYEKMKTAAHKMATYWFNKLELNAARKKGVVPSADTAVVPPIGTQSIIRELNINNLRNSNEFLKSMGANCVRSI